MDKCVSVSEEKDPIGEGVLHSVAKLAGGTAVSRLVVLMAAPLLTRIYTPDDFGVLAVYGSIVNIAVVLSSLRFEFAIPLPEQEDVTANPAAKIDPMLTNGQKYRSASRAAATVLNWDVEKHRLIHVYKSVLSL